MRVRTRSAARGTAALTLACVAAGLGSEATLFLWLEQPADLSTSQVVATAFLRTMLLAGCGLLTLLVLRAAPKMQEREGRRDSIRGRG
jgi:hypothetical protein